MTNLPLNLELAALCMIITLLILAYVAAGKHGVLEGLKKRTPLSGATRNPSRDSK